MVLYCTWSNPAGERFPFIYCRGMAVSPSSALIPSSARPTLTPSFTRLFNPWRDPKRLRLPMRACLPIVSACLVVFVSWWQRTTIYDAFSASPRQIHVNECERTYRANPSVILPRFMIIGGLKTGSSYLHRTLSFHPQLHGSAVKEAYMFAENSLTDLNAFTRLFAGSKPHANPFYSPVGELRSVKSARAVRALFPCMKLIVVARDPIQRAWSHLQMRVREGLAGNSELPLFEDYVFKELAVVRGLAAGGLRDVTRLQTCLKKVDSRQRLVGKCWLLDFETSPVLRLMLSHPTTSLILDGIYSEPVLHWMREFPRDNFLFVKSEAMFVSPQAELDKIHRFLRVDPYAYSADVLNTSVIVHPTDNHTVPGDYGQPMLTHMEHVQAVLKPWNDRWKLISGMDWSGS